MGEHRPSELPSEDQSAAFEVALQFLAPAPVNEAPAHATVIARICNVLTSAIVGTAAVTLGEQARVAVEAEPSTGTVSPEERASVERLRDARQRAPEMQRVPDECVAYVGTAPRRSPRAEEHRRPDPVTPMYLDDGLPYGLTVHQGNA